MPASNVRLTEGSREGHVVWKTPDDLRAKLAKMLMLVPVLTSGFGPRALVSRVLVTDFEENN